MIVKKTSIREQVYELVKTRILTQEYGRDERLNINTLAAELKVSNTPVREALGMLERDGLLSFRTNIGYQVLGFTKQEIAALEETMSILMMGGYELSRFHGRTDALARTLKQKLAAHAECLQGDALAEIAYAAIDFDAAFFNTLHNKAIDDVYQNLFSKMVLLICYEFKGREAELHASYEEHVHILEAVHADDPIQVTRRIAEHFNREVHIE